MFRDSNWRLEITKFPDYKSCSFFNPSNQANLPSLLSMAVLCYLTQHIGNWPTTNFGSLMFQSAGFLRVKCNL